MRVVLTILALWPVAMIAAYFIVKVTLKALGKSELFNLIMSEDDAEDGGEE
jgi:hypothetical protein